MSVYQDYVLQLAQHLYEFRAMAYQMDADSWRNLPVRSKQHYIQIAQDTAERLRPAMNAAWQRKKAAAA